MHSPDTSQPTLSNFGPWLISKLLVKATSALSIISPTIFSNPAAHLEPRNNPLCPYVRWMTKLVFVTRFVVVTRFAVVTRFVMTIMMMAVIDAWVTNSLMEEGLMTIIHSSLQPLPSTHCAHQCLRSWRRHGDRCPEASVAMDSLVDDHCFGYEACGKSFVWCLLK